MTLMTWYYIRDKFMQRYTVITEMHREAPILTKQHTKTTKYPDDVNLDHTSTGQCNVYIYIYLVISSSSCHLQVKEVQVQQCFSNIETAK